MLFNGLPLGGAFQRYSAYVPQEDIFVPTLSACETLQVRLLFMCVTHPNLTLRAAHQPTTNHVMQLTTLHVLLSKALICARVNALPLTKC